MRERTRGNVVAGTRRAAAAAGVDWDFHHIASPSPGNPEECPQEEEIPSERSSGMSEVRGQTGW